MVGTYECGDEHLGSIKCGEFLDQLKTGYFREGIMKCSNEVYNKFTNIRQHNSYLLKHIGYMFRPVNRSSSGLQQISHRCCLEIGTPIFLQL